MSRGLSTWFAVAAVCAALSASADIKPNGLFSDNMVLQQDEELPVFGLGTDGEEVTVQLGNQSAKTTVSDGRWIVKFPPQKAGGPHTLSIAGKNSVTFKNVMVGEVWICSGQSNMQWSVALSADPQETIAQSANPMLRLYTVPRRATPKPQKDVVGAWQVCGPESVKDFSAVAYSFGKDLQQRLNVAVGLINTSYGGTPAEAWTSRETLAAHPALKGLLEVGETMPGESPHRATGLYNAMIAPLVPFAFRGAIWYQGESNADRAYQYSILFPAMIGDWRKSFGQGDFPFLFVQLAPFQKIEKEPGESAWAELREAQRLTLKASPMTGMAVITDLGDEKDIHPKAKAPVGRRLALAARALAYGEGGTRYELAAKKRRREIYRVVSEPITFSGPEFESVSFDGSKAIVKFQSVDGGLVAKDGPLTGFTVAGADKKFHVAQAQIVGDTVVLTSDKVAQPIAVRYGWANYPVVNLFNRAGLPASPFKSDSFPWITASNAAPRAPAPRPKDVKGKGKAKAKAAAN